MKRGRGRVTRIRRKKNQIKKNRRRWIRITRTTRIIIIKFIKNHTNVLSILSISSEHGGTAGQMAALLQPSYGAQTAHGDGVLVARQNLL